MAMMQQQQQPNREMMMKQSQLVSNLQKTKMTDAEENGEVKRVKINTTETKLHTENIVDEEWKKISLGIEKQARAVHLKTTEVTETKVSEFGSELKRTIINNPPLDFKPTTYGSKTATEPKQKKITSSDGSSRSRQDQAPEKSHSKRRRWDEDKSDKGRKYDDDRRARQKQSPSYRSTKTPPRSYRSKVSPPRLLPGGRNVWSLRDDNPTVGKDVGRKAPKQSKDVIVIDDEQTKRDATAKGAEKAPEAKPSSGSSQSTTTTTTTTAASSASSFKFSWMSSKTAKPSLLGKTGVQYGPMPGRKLPAKGMRPSLVIVYTIQLFYIAFATEDRRNAKVLCL